MLHTILLFNIWGPSWSWSYGSWIYNYVIKFVSDLLHVGGFLQVLRFPPLIKLTATIYWNIVESGVKHHSPPPSSISVKLSFNTYNYKGQYTKDNISKLHIFDCLMVFFYHSEWVGERMIVVNHPWMSNLSPIRYHGVNKLHFDEMILMPALY